MSGVEGVGASVPTADAVAAVDDVAVGGPLPVNVTAPVIDRDAGVVALPVLAGLELLVEVAEVVPLRAALVELVPLMTPLPLAIPESVSEPLCCSLADKADDGEVDMVARAEFVDEPDSADVADTAEAVENALMAAVVLASAEAEGVILIVRLERGDALPLGEPEVLRDTGGEDDVDALDDGDPDGAPDLDSRAEVEARGVKLAVPLANVDTLGDDEAADEDVDDSVATSDRETRGLPLSLLVAETADVADDVAVAPTPGDAVRAPVTDEFDVGQAVEDALLLPEGEPDEDRDGAKDSVAAPDCDDVAVAVAHSLTSALCVAALDADTESVMTPLTVPVALAQPERVAAELEVA